LVSLSCLVAIYHQALSAPAADLSCEQKQEAIRNSNGQNFLQWTPACATGRRTIRRKHHLGAKPKLTRDYIPPPANRVIPLKPGQTQPETEDVQLPESYNTRDTYRSKCPGVDHVFYQTCGNCWAVSSTGLINDRVCIYGPDGVDQVYYSVNQMTQCVGYGCDGGWPSSALAYWKNNGMTTGGNPDLQEPLGCLSWPNGGFPDDNTILGNQCPANCDDGSAIATKSYGSQPYQIQSLNETAIMQEIYLYGPVTATFTVYEDLYYDYVSGVYKYSYGNVVGRHAVKMIGWGVENGIKYWLIHNSWGTTYGEGGFYKFERGTNEVDIENEIEAAVPQDTGIAS